MHISVMRRHYLCEKGGDEVAHYAEIYNIQNWMPDMPTVLAFIDMTRAFLNLDTR